MDFLTLSGDEAVDYARLAALFDGVQGYHPSQGSPIMPWRPTKDSK